MHSASRKWWTLIAMCLLTVMLNVDVTALNIAIPAIANEFYASLADMQWVINAYVLLSAMFQILGGRLGDVHGHRKIFLAGVALFIISSAGAGLSINAGMLIAFRVLQGLALGIAYPMTMVLTFAAFPKTQRGFALSLIIAAMGMSLAIGPPIGGLFVNYIGWRWIFYINVPIGILAFILTYLFCSTDQPKEERKITYKGAVFLMIGLLGVIFAVNQVQNWGFQSPLFWITLFLGVIFLVFLYFIERKQSYPIIDFHLFKIRNFLLNNLIRLIVQLVFIPILFFIPLYLQNISGFDAVYAGALMLFLTVVIGILSPIAGKWVDAMGDKIPNVFSMLLFAIACFLFYFLKVKTDIFVLGFGLLLTGIATGISSVSTLTGAISVIPEKQQGVATGIVLTTVWLGCALGVALMGAILTLASQSDLSFRLMQMDLSLPAKQLEVLERVAQGVSSSKILSEYFSGDLLFQVKTASTQSFLRGFRISMLAWMALSLIGLFLSLFLKKHKIKDHEELLPL
ncbi:MAG: MFS transporter [Anaerolineae bacterium]